MELRVSGTTLYAETVGEGRPWLCLHGGPGTDSSGPRGQLAFLADALGVRLVFYDHRGHGRSEWVPVEQCTHDQLVADVDGVREALDLARVSVLGISWGGYLGLMYAARHPDRVQELVVVGASPSYEFHRQAEANARREATKKNTRSSNPAAEGLSLPVGMPIFGRPVARDWRERNAPRWEAASISWADRLSGDHRGAV